MIYDSEGRGLDTESMAAGLRLINFIIIHCGEGSDVITLSQNRENLTAILVSGHPDTWWKDNVRIDDEAGRNPLEGRRNV